MVTLPDGVRVFDAEANGLLYDVTECHCIVQQIGNKLYGYWDDKSVEAPPGVVHSGSVSFFVHHILRSSTDIFVGHNIMGYDIPMFKKLFGYQTKVFDTPGKYFDSFLSSCLLRPDQKSHSLDYYGEKYGIPKPAHEDWSTLTTEMIHRCAEDVKIQARLFMDQWKKFEAYPQWNDALHLEQQVSFIHSQQGLHGVRIDILRAYELLKYIDRRINVVKDSLLRRLPKVCEGTDGFKNTFKKDGSLSFHVLKYFTDCGIDAFDPDTMPISDYSVTGDSAVRVGGQFSRISFRDVNLNSSDEIKEILYRYGWKPTEWNYKKDKGGRLMRDERGQLIKTSPKLTEDSYESLPEGLGQDIAEYLMLCHRRRFIANEKDPSGKGAMSFVRDTGYAPADGFTCGTNTSRYRHFGILVNLPRPSSILGTEIRSIFTVPQGHQMLGIDLSGIEARIMAHFAYFYDGGAYAKVALEGDVHQANADLLGISRDDAKSFLYAISYGAGPGKLATILNCGVQEAKEQIQLYWDTHFGLRDFIEALEGEYRRNGHWITGIDGRKLYIRSEHKLLNTAVQNAATVVFKKWMVKSYKWTEHRNSNPGNHHLQQIIAYHDELEFDYYGGEYSIARSICESIVGLIKEVGEEMELEVPLTGDFKIGQNYAEVH